MQKSKYPRFVCKSSMEILEDYDNDRCYKLTFPISKKGVNSILVIGRAPKTCNDFKCDKLIQRVLKYIDNKREEFGPVIKVNIVNLFTTIEYDRNSIENSFKNRGECFVTGNDDLFESNGATIKNDDIIRKSIEESDYIILGWGEVLKEIESIYNLRVEYILKTIREINSISSEEKKLYIVGDLTKKGYPRHCVNWNLQDPLIEFQW
ncbi:hypothetical protein CSC2_46140 [Clostridium zeae]|uniref:DUF1643 domain-containing protein n=1 Tax=Clostridium zeae TaxID=2759022 RepID=A0ABQ1EGX6_9CLOT|nr:DUF1643 domain-containing protein [Clostridium zeae]GFZ34088.1 hypothetical protein CSC2_46140 [Clostridium zeae]